MYPRIMFLKNSIRIFINLIIISSTLIGFQACSNDDGNPITSSGHERGEIAQSNKITDMTVNDIRQIFTAAQMTIPFTLNYSVEAYSIKYYTIDANGNETVASGAIFLPKSANNLPLVSIQHGTQTKSSLVASVSPISTSEGIVSLIMASMGYMVVTPDYIGFGVSDVMHPYMHATSLVSSVIDFIRAGKTYSSENQITLNGRLFLAGYSEGGYATLLAQKEIEENYSAEFDLTAVAPLSGPYDLSGMMQTIFQSTSYSTPAYIAYFFTAYNEIYGWDRLNDIFAAPYASEMPGLFDGSKTWGEIGNQLPATFSEMMNADFVTNYINGNEQIVVTAVQENTQLNWLPVAPLHFFHGDADEIVPIQNAFTAINAFTSNGATNIQLTTIPGGTHESTGPAAIVGAIQWFEDF